MRTVTILLQAWRRGDEAARDELASRIYGELHGLAAGYLRNERPNHTLQPAALVAEAYLRLSAAETPEFADRSHFFAIAAHVMRQVLVDHARKRDTAKRGDGVRPETLDEMTVAYDQPHVLIALDDALSALGKLDERKARVIELHYFGGLTQVEVADVLGVHPNTIGNDLRLGLAWLKRELAGASA